MKSCPHHALHCFFFQFYQDRLSWNASLDSDTDWASQSLSRISVPHFYECVPCTHIYIDHNFSFHTKKSWSQTYSLQAFTVWLKIKPKNDKVWDPSVIFDLILTSWLLNRRTYNYEETTRLKPCFCSEKKSL